MNDRFSDSGDDIIETFQGCTSLTTSEFSETCQHFRNNGLSILHLNIRGCRTNFLAFSSWLSVLNANFACIALTETNITEDKDVDFSIRGYKCENLYLGHGIKLYIRQNLHYKIVESLKKCNDIIECLFAKISFRFNKDIVLGVVYRPHSSTIRVFNDYFEEHVISKLRPSQTTMLCGDFNINLNNVLTDSSIEEFSNLMSSNNFCQGITEITRYNVLNPSNSSIIDHIWTNFNRPFSTYVIQCGLSDHYPIIVYTEFINSANTMRVTFRDYSQQNFDSFLNDLPTRWENSLLPLSTASESVNCFINWLNNILNLYFPIKTKQLGLKNIRNPWMTNNLLLCIKKKHMFYKLQKNGLLTRAFYNRYRNLVTFAIKRTKMRYYNNAFIAARTDIKGTWRILNDLLDRKRKNTVNELEVSYRGCTTTVTDPFQIATELNTFFSSIPAEIHNSLPPANDPTQFDNFPTIRNSIFLSRSCDAEVRFVINSFDSKKCNLHDFPFKLLKAISPYVSSHIASLFNLMIVEGHYPDILKKARITPVLKTGSPLQCNNYRPISVLNSINKIFERLISNRLNDFLTVNNVIYKHQYGFAANKGTTDACIKVINALQFALRNDDYVVAVFL